MTAAQSWPERTVTRQHPPLLLLAEDDAPLRQMLSWELADLGDDVTAAAGRSEARRSAQR
jgi:hypothetical protein